MLMKESKIGNPGAIRVDEFTNKWNLALPIKILENFQIFDEKLTVDEAFREDSVSSFIVNNYHLPLLILLWKIYRIS